MKKGGLFGGLLLCCSTKPRAVSAADSDCLCFAGYFCGEWVLMVKKRKLNLDLKPRNRKR